MSSLRKYFQQEMKLSMLTLEHSKTTDFYLSVWQTTRSVVPFFALRAFLFLSSLGITLASLILNIINNKLPYWFIYLTHWGLTVNTFATGFAFAVSARCFFRGPISTEFRLPWYVKVYWLFYNIAVPLAFLITVFYWTVLYEAGIQEEFNHGLDVAIHGLNSVIMFLLLASSSHPHRLLHIYQPVGFGLIYVIFGAIYYLAGGVDRWGNPWIYPVIDWSKPGPTFGVVCLTSLMLFVLHNVVVLMSIARDAIVKAIIKPSVTVHIDEGLPLRNGQSQA